jgi:hypothetical protein
MATPSDNTCPTPKVLGTRRVPCIPFSTGATQLASGPYRRRRSCRSLLLSVQVGLAVLLAASACAPKPTLPQLYPVRGRAVYEGGSPVRGGSVSFQSLDHPEVSTSGAIGPDGTFSLSSFKAGIRSSGATVGPHQVVIYFADPSTPTHSFAAPFVVEAKDNECTLTVPKRR